MYAAVTLQNQNFSQEMSQAYCQNIIEEGHLLTQASFETQQTSLFPL